jgi:phosphogluconate dehydratase
MIEHGELVWRDGPTESFDKQVVASVEEPFKTNGGLSVLCGNLGRAVMKTSALKEPHFQIKAPAVVFEDQFELHAAFQAGELDKDCVVVVRFQGPSAIGMPELHSLTPPLAVLQDRGFKVALVTDGRMSGASGKVPAAIHVTPEAIKGGILAKIKTGDMVELNTETGAMDVLLSEQELAKREAKAANISASQIGMGRELFAGMRSNLTGAETGACSLFVGQD